MEKATIATALNSMDARTAVEIAARNHGLGIVLEEAPNTDPQAFLERVSSLRPKVVFIETSRMWGPLHRVVELLRASEGAPAVIVMHGSPDPETILEAMRAGAAEFIYPPFAANTVNSLERWLRERENGGRLAGG
jgi:DNA-binding NtrC family response regulator